MSSKASEVNIHSFTMILGRMEVAHLEEWLQHQVILGVEKTWIVLEQWAIDSRSSQYEAGQIWAKKPGANYHENLSDGEVIQIIFDICEKVEEETGMFIEVIPATCENLDIGKRQVFEFNMLLQRLRSESSEPDWMIFCDVDELIHTPGRSFKDMLALCPAAMSMIFMKQVLFDSRWDTRGNPVAMKEIEWCYGHLKFNQKGIYRLKGKNTVERMKNVHGASVRSGPAWRPQTRTVRFHHYRGVPTEHECSLGFVKGMKRYCKLRSSLLERRRRNTMINDQIPCR